MLIFFRIHLFKFFKFGLSKIQKFRMRLDLVEANFVKFNQIYRKKYVHLNIISILLDLTQLCRIAALTSKLHKCKSIRLRYI